MKDFSKQLMRMASLAAAQAKNMVDEVNETLSSIDWDEQWARFNERKEALVRRGNAWLDEFNDFVKQVRESVCDFKVTVPFDPNTEEYSYNIDGEKLFIEVTFNSETTSRCSKTTVVIPEHCDVSRIQTEVNKVKKTLTITIPKFPINTTDEDKDVSSADRCPDEDTNMTASEDGVLMDRRMEADELHPEIDANCQRFADASMPPEYEVNDDTHSATEFHRMEPTE